jgi:hypothetical protein
VIPKHYPAVGDLTFEVGFAAAALLYAAFFRRGRVKSQDHGGNGLIPRAGRGPGVRGPQRRRNVTGSGVPCHVTVCRAGVERATT